ncbi:HNH endonuclease signature motif containing protein [Variovorax sp. dw_308]|uniref:HNH endonuclease signature motif containing protein n=1 Tax=Variovorax sp. dw_308 TaxID=2721546 RepID=UPI001C4594CA|nr:HNH endonuclease signature motif containing protein [Variovorax sp. dw_308]
MKPPRLKTLKPRLATANLNQLKSIDSDSWRAGKTTTERLYGYAWQRARLRHLSSSPLCVLCEAAGFVKLATVVDHKTPHRGDETLFWDESNWQSLCATHHSSDKQREERSGRKRKAIGPDGWPV